MKDMICAGVTVQLIVFYGLLFFGAVWSISYASLEIDRTKKIIFYTLGIILAFVFLFLFPMSMKIYDMIRNFYYNLVGIAL